MRSIKVLQLGKFYYPDTGGIETTMQDIVQGLNNANFQNLDSQTHFICDVLCSNSKNKSSHEIINENMQNYRIWRTRSFGKFASTSITPQMIFALRFLVTPYDIIHIHLPDPMANLALFGCNLSGKKIVLHWHSDIIKQKHLLKLYAPLQTWMLKRADKIIATSPKYIQESSVLKQYAHKCVSIPIGIDKCFSTAKSSQSNTDKKIIFSLGRLAQNKGFEYLIESMKFLPQEYELQIGGDGVQKNKLESIIKKHNLQNRVKMLGAIRRQDVGAYYQNCHIFALSSIQESYGIVLLEAMSFAKPIICTKLSPSGSDFINQNDVTGIVIPPKNPLEIANAVLKISANYNFYARNAKERFEQLFTKDKMINSIKELYIELINGGGGA